MIPPAAHTSVEEQLPPMDAPEGPSSTSSNSGAAGAAAAASVAAQSVQSVETTSSTASAAASIASHSADTTSSAAAAAASSAAAASASTAADAARAASMAKIAGQNARHFRTMLKVAARGVHVADACSMLTMRAQQGLPFLADDVNTVLSPCVFLTEAETIKYIVGTLKAADRLDHATDEALLSDARRMLEAHDTGPIPDLAHEHNRRSADMHDPAYRESLAAASGNKRKRGGGDGAAGSAAAAAAAADELGDDAASAAATATPSAPAESPFKHAMELLTSTFAVPPGRYAGARLGSARRVFDAMPVDFRVAPNARTFVLMMHGAVAAGDVGYASDVLRRMLESGVATLDTLYTHMQPAFLRRMVAAGVLEDSPSLLAAEPNSDKWCFLTAAAEAAKGDQFGSKHGAVLTKDGVAVTTGRNHRYAPAGDAHVRVMHSEVHALVKLADPEKDAAGMHCWIVELDAYGEGRKTCVCVRGVGEERY